VRRRVLIIANPAAGGSRRSRRRLGQVVAALERRGSTVTLRHTAPAEGDAERLARDLAVDFDIVVAAGGDGTVNAIVNGIAGCGGAPPPVAVLPFGTANVLAREIGLPHQPEALAELIAAGPARAIWPGRAGARLFLTTASSGFDAETVAAVDSRLKRVVGRGAFAWAIAVCLWRYRACAMRLRVDGTDYPAIAVIAAKGRRYAGRFVVAPRASLADPTLELVLFQRAGRLAVLRYLGALACGRLADRDDVSVLRCRTATLAADRAVPVQADGEIIGFLPITLAVADRTMRLICPPNFQC
jgi:diacylglycerol kinase (ATP)